MKFDFDLHRLFATNPLNSRPSCSPKLSRAKVPAELLARLRGQNGVITEANARELRDLIISANTTKP